MMLAVVPSTSDIVTEMIGQAPTSVALIVVMWLFLQNMSRERDAAREERKLSADFQSKNAAMLASSLDRNSEALSGMAESVRTLSEATSADLRELHRGMTNLASKQGT